MRLSSRPVRAIWTRRTKPYRTRAAIGSTISASRPEPTQMMALTQRGYTAQAQADLGRWQMWVPSFGAEPRQGAFGKLLQSAREAALLSLAKKFRSARYPEPRHGRSGHPEDHEHDDAHQTRELTRGDHNRLLDRGVEQCRDDDRSGYSEDE